MHPSQMSGFRKTVIISLTIAFAGALLVFTAQANLDLLKSVYPEPSFYMFGLLALEGGVVYWTGYYLLHLSGVHKGIAVIALAVDAILSGAGFFYEMESVTKSVGTIALPPVIVVVAFAVVFNVGMAIISHLIPSGSAAHPQMARPKESLTNYEQGYQEARSLAQTDTVDKGPGFFSNTAAAVLAKGQDIAELAKEKRSRRNQTAAAPVAEEEAQAKN